MSNDKQNQTPSGSPVQRLVGQLRELLARVPQGTWKPQRNNFGIGVIVDELDDDFTNVCFWMHDDVFDHTEACRDLIIEAMNALPNLLIVAEAASNVCSHSDSVDKEAAIAADIDFLQDALNLLHNATDQRAGPAPG